MYIKIIKAKVSIDLMQHFAYIAKVTQNILSKLHPELF